MKPGPLWWLVAVVTPALALSAAHKHVDHEHWPEKFDRHFRKYAKHYFGPHVDWRWFKAQGIAESGLRPNALSPAGAVGVMQILPSTYGDIRKKMPFLADIRDPRWNIAAGIFYDRQLYRKWKRKRQVRSEDRLAFAFGSYNAGYGNVLKAYKKARNKKGDEVKRWTEVAPYAPGETRAYVKRIKKLMKTR